MTEMFNAEGKLTLLEQFQHDFGLPKFTRRRAIARGSVGFLRSEDGGIMMPQPGVMHGPFRVANPIWRRTSYSIAYEWLVKQAKEKLAPPPTLSIDEFFRSVVNSPEELQVVDDRSESYRRALAAAQKNGQESRFTVRRPSCTRSVIARCSPKRCCATS